MTSKDSEKETDRPHYYSQFWLDVAAGRTVIGAHKVEDDAELAEDETDLEEPEPTPLRRAGRNNTAPSTDGYMATQTQSVAEPEIAPEEFAESEEDEFDLENDVEDLELPDDVLAATEEVTIPVEPEATEEVTITPEPDVIKEDEETGEEDEEDEEELFYDEEEDEEEDEEGWNARGRKKPKPGRQVKAPKPTKKPKREPRRGF